MLSSAQIKKIVTEARPIIERQLEDATKLAGLRDVVAAAGGDWSQLKALIKAQIRDEETGDGKHVRKILDKADYALGYADMLGLGGPNMNEENFSDATDHDAEDNAKRSAALDALAALDADIIDADGVIIEREVAAATAVGASPAIPSQAAGQAAKANEEADDVAPPPAHAPEQPGTDHGSARTPAEGGVNSAAVSQPVTIPAADPTVVVTASDRSAASPSAAPVADHSRPNPICRDPDDCGVYASWHLPCESCKAAAAHRSAA